MITEQDISVTDVIATFSAFLRDQLGATGKVSLLPLWLKEAPEVERDWPRTVEYGVACVVESEEDWFANAASAVSLCSGDRLLWIAEEHEGRLQWLTEAKQEYVPSLAVVTAARIRRLKSSDLLPSHSAKVYGGLVMIITIGMRSDRQEHPVVNIEVSVEAKSQ